MKYKIFASGNQKELRPERFAVKEVVAENTALRNLFDVFLFEDLPAKGKSPIRTYLKQIDNSEILIVIMGKEYGIKGKDGLSATEREFRRFRKIKPKEEIIAFIKGDNKEDAKRDKDTQIFVKTIKNSLIYKRFTSVNELKIQILHSLISYLDEKGGIPTEPFDQLLCKEMDYDDIDEKEVRGFLENRAIKLKVEIPKISVKDFLVKTLGVVKKSNGKLFPTNAALLFFGKNPSICIPQNEIRIARFKGTTRLEFIDSQEIKGPIYKILEQIGIFFKRNTRLANKIVEFKRIDIPEYPYEAIREGVINAIAHRDYFRHGAPIMVSIFDDRVEIGSPGGLLPGLNINKLEGHHVSRNKKICEIFHETKDMEKFGTGISKMKKLMEDHGLPEPEFLEEGDFFVVKFYGPKEKILDLVSGIPEGRKTDLKELGLNERQIEALRLMVNEKKAFSNKEYRQKFKVSNQTYVRDMRVLSKVGFVVPEGRGRALKYGAK
jgi:predicted HTH transcriptional regulator